MPGSVNLSVQLGIFEGRYLEGEVIKRAAICIGPEYDTVGYDLVKRLTAASCSSFADRS